MRRDGLLLTLQNNRSSNALLASIGGENLFYSRLSVSLSLKRKKRLL